MLNVVMFYQVSVHLVCYRNGKESNGPWYCELCEDSLANGSIVHGANSSDRPNPSTECSLCGISNGALRKTTNGQWVHALCAEVRFPAFPCRSLHSILQQ